MHSLARNLRVGSSRAKQALVQAANEGSLPQGAWPYTKLRVLRKAALDLTSDASPAHSPIMAGAAQVPTLFGPSLKSGHKLLAGSGERLEATWHHVNRPSQGLSSEKSLRRWISSAPGRGGRFSRDSEPQRGTLDRLRGAVARGADGADRGEWERGGSSYRWQDGFAGRGGSQAERSRDYASREEGGYGRKEGNGRGGDRQREPDSWDRTEGSNGRWSRGREEGQRLPSEGNTWSRNGPSDRARRGEEDWRQGPGSSSASSWEISGGTWGPSNRSPRVPQEEGRSPGRGMYSSDRGAAGRGRGGRGGSSSRGGGSRSSQPWLGRGSLQSKRESSAGGGRGRVAYPWSSGGRTEREVGGSRYGSEGSRSWSRSENTPGVFSRPRAGSEDEWERKPSGYSREGGFEERRGNDRRGKVEEEFSPPVVSAGELKTSDWWEREGLGLPPKGALVMPPGAFKKDRPSKEDKWKLKMARKREKRMLEQEQQPSFEDFLQRKEMGEEWRRRKKEWLVEEIVAMRPNPIVKLLNAQRSWINIQDVRDLIHTLLERGEGPRAVRTLKWVRQMEWYEPDFATYTKLAEEMARMSKLSRCTELYDMMITHGMVPAASTYEKIIAALIKDGQGSELETAWAMYERMKQFAELTPPPTLQKMLFRTLSEGPWNVRQSGRAERVLRDMQDAGLQGTGDMYGRLCELAGKRGDVAKVDALLEEMRSLGLEPSKTALAAVVHACALAPGKEALPREAETAEREGKGGHKKQAEGTSGRKDPAEEEEGREEAEDGDTGRVALQAQRVELAERAERGLREMVDAGKKPDCSVYVALMGTFVKARWHHKVEGLWEEMKESGTPDTLKVYNVVMEAFAGLGEIEKAEALLAKMVQKGMNPLHDAHNSMLKLYVGKGMTDKVEEGVAKMEEGGCPPNQASYNLQIEAYLKEAAERGELSKSPADVETGGLDKAWQVYEKMKTKGGVGPNQQTFEMLVKALDAAGKSSQVKELYADMHTLLGSRFKLPEEVKEIAKKVVGTKRVLHDEKQKLKLHKHTRELLAGVLLGGARIETHDRDRTYEIHFEQETDDIPKARLINHLYQEFRDWTIRAPAERTKDGGDPAGNEDSPRLIHFATVSHGSFRFFAHQYYPNGKGVIPRLIHRWLSHRALAYWYMYGGSRCPSTGGIMLNAKDYSAKEVKMVVHTMKARTIDCERKKRKSGDVIRFTGKSADWLWKLMEPYIIPEMKDVLRPIQKKSSEEAERAEYDEEEEEEEERGGPLMTQAAAGGRRSERGARETALREDDETAFVSVGTKEMEMAFAHGVGGSGSWSDSERMGEDRELEGAGTRTSAGGFRNRERDSNGSEREKLRKWEKQGNNGTPGLAKASEGSSDWQDEGWDGTRRSQELPPWQEFKEEGGNAVEDSEGNEEMEAGVGGMDSGEESGSDSDDETDWVGLADAVESEKVRPVPKRPKRSLTR